MNKIKSFVVVLVFVLSKSALFFAACVSGDCVAARVKMLEEQAKIIGILNIDTYKRAFGVHHELAQIISERAGVSPEYYGISFETKKMNQYVIGKKIRLKSSIIIPNQNMCFQFRCCPIML